jgi:hypothetical protein
MKKLFAMALTAGALLLAAPTLTTPAAAQPDVNVRVGPGGVSIRGDVDRHRHRHYRHRHGHGHYGYYRGPRCKTTVVIRNGQRTTIRRCR